MRNYRTSELTLELVSHNALNIALWGPAAVARDADLHFFSSFKKRNQQRCWTRKGWETREASNLSYAAEASCGDQEHSADLLFAPPKKN